MRNAFPDTNEFVFVWMPETRFDSLSDNPTTEDGCALRSAVTDTIFLSETPTTSWSCATRVPSPETPRSATPLIVEGSE